MTNTVITAWEAIGWEDTGDDRYLRVVGGRTLYETATFYDNTPGHMVKLSRIDTRYGIRQIDRYVDPDTLLEVVAAP